MSYYPGIYIGPKCVDEPPCTPAQATENARARAKIGARERANSKAACQKEGGRWNEGLKKCVAALALEPVGFHWCKGWDKP
jgi:hypothetical protein